MSLIRPEASAALVRWREVGTGVALAATGGWMAMQGGYLPVTFGLLVAVGGVALAVNGWRRLRFQRAVTAPGVVEVDEGRVSYFGPFGGGSVDVPDLAEVALIGAGGQRLWRLAQPGQPVVLIPLAAEGAAALADALVVLPGLDMGRLSRALDAPADQGVVIWTRKVLSEA